MDDDFPDGESPPVWLPGGVLLKLWVGCATFSPSPFAIFEMFPLPEPGQTVLPPSRSGEPTIKGIFVNSHIRTVRNERGEEGIRQLERLYGSPLEFRNSENVPVREEVRIIEYAHDVLNGVNTSAAERSFEAGRLHFRNFTTTPLARIIFALFRQRFKLMMMQTQNIAGHVFQGVKFSSKELGPSAVQVIMENNDYPIDHFRGLFHEWMHFAGHTGTVDARESSPNVYEYTIQWK